MEKEDWSMKNYILDGETRVFEVKTGLTIFECKTQSEARKIIKEMNGGKYGFNGFTPAHLVKQ